MLSSTYASEDILIILFMETINISANQNFNTLDSSNTIKAIGFNRVMFCQNN